MSTFIQTELERAFGKEGVLLKLPYQTCVSLIDECTTAMGIGNEDVLNAILVLKQDITKEPTVWKDANRLLSSLCDLEFNLKNLPLKPWEIERETQRLRKELIDSIKRGNPIYFPKPSALGDTIIFSNAYATVLQMLCGEEGIDPTTIQLKTYDEFVDGTPEGIDLKKRCFRIAPPNFDIPVSIHEQYLQCCAQALGISLDDNRTKMVPQLIPVENTALERIDIDAITELSTSIREVRHTEGKKVVVIGQSGSEMAKRPTDKQIAQIAEVISKVIPDAYIIVVTDKKYLQRNAGYGPYSTHEPAFMLSLDDVTPTAYGTSVSEVISDNNLNIVGGYLGSADHLIVPDSFLAWLGASCIGARKDRNRHLQPRDVFVYYTLANSKVWGIPEAIPIPSQAWQKIGEDAQSDQMYVLDARRYGMLSPEKKRIVCNSDGFVSDADIEQVCERLRTEFLAKR